MSATLLRLGLWTTLIVVALYVLHETYADSPVGEYLPEAMLQKVLVVGLLLVVAGLFVRLLEKGQRVVVKNRCAVCHTPIPHGAIYCRAHLRRVLHDEEDRTHGTRTGH